MACNGASNNSNGNANISKNTNGNAPNTTVNTTANTNAKVPVYTYEIVKTYPHDSRAFTQGLVIRDNVFYESAGEYGKSNLRKVDVATGKVLQEKKIADSYFAEGMTILNDKIYQITWKENTAFVYDLKDFKLLKEFKYAGQGWGLTHDGTNLLMSDGTHIIRVVNPETFETIRTIVVLDEKGKPIMELNELEYIKGEIWANIWQEGWIIRIDPASGKLLGRIDLNKLADEQVEKSDTADVLNGIAYDAAADRIFITGKLWSNLFEIKVQPKQ
jgi:glutamine cyclotransferase